MTEASARNPLLKPSLTFVLLVVGAMLLSVIPIVSLPFSWTATFFHEISHGLMAIATGGSIVKINLYPNGAGLCTSIGGSPFLIAFAGYFGAVLWGVLIYKSV
ncbi:MAG: M50 family metallopeptidase, partial [Sphingomonadales bacterium]